MKTTFLATLRRGLLILAAAASFLAPAPATAQSDAGDPANLKRYEGSVLFTTENERFTQYDFLMSPRKKGSFPDDPQAYPKKEILEGSLTRLGYAIPDKEVTVLEVYRNYQEDLAANGWEILFSAYGEKELGGGNFGFRSRTKQAFKGTQTIENELNDPAYIAARRTDPDGDTYATVWVVKHDNGLLGKFDKLVSKGMTIVKVDVIKPKAMERRMVLVNAAKMQQDIAKDGHISLYGILFDFNKADLKPESKPTLDEIGKLLKDDASLKLMVVGHTDNVGTLDFNRDLSTRRAAAVVQELTTTYGIDPTRLHGEGVAFLAPVASNETDAGREKNRRVELVRW
jgi:OmpA-OmpF porin, OOP family